MHPGDRLPRHALQRWALTFSLIVAPQPLPPSPPPDDLLSELAAKVAAALDSNAHVRLAPVSLTGADQPSVREATRELARILTRRGVTITDRRDDVTMVSLTCSRNLRDRVCAAAIGNGATRTVVVAARPDPDAMPRPAPSIPGVLELRPVLAQSEPILDAVTLDERLLVLDPRGLTIYDKTADGWRRGASRSFRTARPWPRDVRGKLRVDSATWQAFLPGMSCHGTFDATTVSCVDEQRPWPIGVENDGIAPGRNAFVMPGGPTYFSGASLEPGAGARWLIATDEGRLAFLDNERKPIDSVAGFGDDVAAMSTPCAPGTHVVVSQPGADRGADTVRLLRVVDRQFVDAAPPVALAGHLTALWTTAPGNGAIAVTRNPISQGYEAFQIGLACGR